MLRWNCRLSARFSLTLTVHIEHKLARTGLHQLRVGRLAGEDRVQMVPLDGCPQQTILDNVSGVLLDLIIHQIIVDEPEHIGLRSAWERAITL